MTIFKCEQKNRCTLWNTRRAILSPLADLSFRLPVLSYYDSSSSGIISDHLTEVRFASFLSGGFTSMALMNPPEKKLEKRISVHLASLFEIELELNSLNRLKCK